jgi:hypothetical protein
MTDDRSRAALPDDELPMATDSPAGLLDTLLWPLRLPGRVISDVERASRALLSIQSAAEVHLASVDHQAGELVGGLSDLLATMSRVEAKIDGLTSLEATIKERMDGLREDLNTRMLAVEAEVRGIRSPIAQVTRDVQTISRLLPDPGGGPLSRLKDSLTPS